MGQDGSVTARRQSPSVYAEITQRIMAGLEAGRVLWGPALERGEGADAARRPFHGRASRR